MLGLELPVLILLGLCIFTACAFEFVNGFHDTANAVATVIYTNTLRPWVAVVWSAFWNFLGVMAGGVAVAMGVLYLLPTEALVDPNVYHSVAMIAALLVAAIIWNLGTWYYGLPASSSHTLIGSILGVGLAFSFLPESHGAAVNWAKAGEAGLALIISPVIGFGLTVVLMFVMRRLVKDKRLFKEPHKRKPPPLWIRLMLVGTCTSVSFFHGSNDGQKGVGLMMLILIGIVPAHFALDSRHNIAAALSPLTRIESIIRISDNPDLAADERTLVVDMSREAGELHRLVATSTAKGVVADSIKFPIRRDILLLAKQSQRLLKSDHLRLSIAERKMLEDDIKSLRTFTDYAPDWVLLLISLSLGCGTMIGWQRIVKTVGEKIGKEHLTYAQGASAELVAASTIGLSTGLGLPVSTTHILSSGIAGSMVASRGLRNLNASTVRSIALAWILTLPVSIVLSGSLFLLFRWMVR
jgi:phosphate/sulfate permease